MAVAALAPKETALSCPMCSSYAHSDYRVVAYGETPVDGIYPILRCKRHGIEFADALPCDHLPDEEAGSLQAIGSLQSLYGDPDIPTPRYQYFMDRVESVTGKANGRTLHDAGCGIGNLMLEARRRGWTVQGNDLVAEVRPEIERRGATCFIGALPSLHLPPSSCDVVTSFCVLPHHLTEPNENMQAAFQLLKPGGWMILEFPDNGPYRRAAKVIYRTIGNRGAARHAVGNLYRPGGHQFAYTRTNMIDYLKWCGFSRVTVEDYSSSTKCSLDRFASRPLWHRAAAATAVYSLKLSAHILGISNHAIAFARK